VPLPSPIAAPSATNAPTLAHPSGSLSTSPSRAPSVVPTKAPHPSASQASQDLAQQRHPSHSCSHPPPVPAFNGLVPPTDDLPSGRCPSSRSFCAEHSVTALGPLGESIKSWGTVFHGRRHFSSVLPGSPRVEMSATRATPDPHISQEMLPSNRSNPHRKVRGATRCDSASEQQCPASTPRNYAPISSQPQCDAGSRWLQGSPPHVSGPHGSSPLATPRFTKSCDGGTVPPVDSTAKVRSFSGQAPDCPEGGQVAHAPVPPVDTALRLRSFSGATPGGPVVKQVPLSSCPRLIHAAEAGCRLIQEDLQRRRQQLRERQACHHQILYNWLANHSSRILP
jgi:hypothetical protein